MSSHLRAASDKIARWSGSTLLLGTWLATLIAFAGKWHWYADLFAHFRPQYLVAFGALTFAFLLARFWKHAATAFLGFLICAAVLLAHFRKPEAPPPLNSALELRCVSLNLLQGNSDRAAVEEFLRRSEADVVILQEVTPKWATVLKRLEDIYPAQTVRATKDSKGAAFITRIKASRIYFDPFPSDPQVGAIVGELESTAGAIKVLGVHSHKPTSATGAEAQQRYFTWLRSRSGGDSSPVVLLGDFNATPWSHALSAFTSATSLRNAGNGNLFSATWNRGRPIQLFIDHAFLSAHWRVLKRQVGPPVGSDHRPLILDLALPL